MFDFLFLVVGIVLLIKGSDWFVDGASNIAKVFKIPSLIIGLTIVAFGTSAPEAAVSISASIKGSSAVALGNVVGSNIFNLLVVVGISALFTRLHVEKDVIRRDYPFNILTTLAIIFVVCDVVFDGAKTMTVSRTDGLLLLCLFAVYMYYLIAGALNQRQTMSFEKPERSVGMSILFLIVGLVAVVAGGQLTVDGACGIARSLGVSENMIALTIVAVGTSLPELVTSVTALRKGESDIAIGNVIGSNVFNLLFIIGVASTIRPLSADSTVLVDSLILLLVNLVVYGFILKNKSIGKKSGGVMVAMYIAFALYVVLRGIA